MNMQALPAYLNADCLQKALEKAYPNEKIKLKTWQWKLANISGANFCSNIFRLNGSFEILTPVAHDATVDGEEREFHFIVKDMIMEIAEIGTNELVMYEKILPEMQNIFKSEKKLAARCFLAQANKEHEFYIFEDLNALGFGNGNRFEGLEVFEAELVMTKIAKFHAASMVFEKKFPDIVASLNPAHFADGAADFIAKSIVKNGMEFAKAQFEHFDEELFKKMTNLSKNFDEKIKAIVEPSKSAFNVLNHGDLWVNNILIKNGGTANGETIFVDFQNAFWGSPAYDLLYFLYTSLPLATLQTQRFKLLSLYYETLKSTLFALNYAVLPTWHDLQKEMQRCALIGYYAALCELPICCMSEADAAGFTASTFVGSNDEWKKIYKSKTVREFVWHAVLHFQEIGLFDE